MKKIPTLFKRDFIDHKTVAVHPEVTPGMEWVLEGEGDATVKIDGACCMLDGAALYKRYDAKKGKKPPEGAIPCCDPDPVTGHWPHWVKVDPHKPEDKWFCQAFINTPIGDYAGEPVWTYEAIGPHFQGNPYERDYDVLIPHGKQRIEVERTFDGIREYLRTHAIEGIVFWKDGEPKCKIKRSDFGFKWPVKFADVDEMAGKMGKNEGT